MLYLYFFNAAFVLVGLSVMKTTYVKLLSFCTFLVAVTGLTNCNKQSNKPPGITANKIIAVTTCNEFVQNGVPYSICLDSVRSDSRCARGAQCIWEGNASAKFTFTAGVAAHHFSLNTTTHAGADKLPNDTVIENMRIKLVNLTPYPDLNIPFNYNAYKAEVEISQQ